MRNLCDTNDRKPSKYKKKRKENLNDNESVNIIEDRNSIIVDSEQWKAFFKFFSLSEDKNIAFESIYGTDKVTATVLGRFDGDYIFL